MHGTDWLIAGAVVIGVVLIVVGIVAWGVSRAPDGWEDDDGFHKGKRRE